MKNLLLITIVFLTVTAAQAESLRIVQVAAPDINCVFDPKCTFIADSSTAEISVPVSGMAILHTRTIRGVKGAPAAGLYAYIYRVDLRKADGIVNDPCVISLTLNFGNVVQTLDFDGDGKKGDEVFVITRGGVGSVGLASATRTGSRITFNFADNVCAGGGASDGDSTFFFGLAARNAPRTTEVGLTGFNTSYKSEARVPRVKDPLAEELDLGPSPKRDPKLPEPNPGPFAGPIPPRMGLAGNGGQPVVRKLSPTPCVDRGGTAYIYGYNFGPRQGSRIVELGGHGIGIILDVRSWSNNLITAVVPDDARIQSGQWYYIGLQDENRHWISNISRTINICRGLF
jgi:hypothetical protein